MTINAFPKRRLPARYAGLVMPFVLSIPMTLIVSAVSSLKNLGFGSGFFGIWPSAWFLSWLVAFPTLLLLLPLVRRIVGFVCEPPSR